MVDAVGVGDERVGGTAQIEQAIPVGVVACEARDLQPQHDAHVAECDFGGHLCKTRACGQARTGNAEILVNHADLTLRPAQRCCPLDKLILPGGGFAVVLYLCRARLADVDECASGKVGRRDLRIFSHRLVPFVVRFLRRLFFGRRSWPAGVRAHRAPRSGTGLAASTKDLGWARSGSVDLSQSSGAAALGSASLGGRETAVSALLMRRRRGATTVRACNNSQTDASGASLATEEDSPSSIGFGAAKSVHVAGIIARVPSGKTALA
jgi:hypothetical protein